MKKYILLITLIFINLLTGKIILSAENLAQKLSGKILLQVESHGKAWYVNPTDYKKYYLNLPTDAFNLMRNLGIGITNKNLNKIPIGIIKYNDQDDDNDNDGLSNDLENAIGTDPQNNDSDNDGYNDKIEVINNYNPTGNGKQNIDQNFTKQHLGKFFLQTEKDGQAWYINPTDEKRYYLKNPSNAFIIMRQLSLGITNKNIDKITTGYLNKSLPKNTNNTPNDNSKTTVKYILYAANAIRSGDFSKAKLYFEPHLHTILKYNINYLDNDGLNTWADNLYRAKLSNSTVNKKTYSIKINFSGGDTNKEYSLKKQKNGTWLLANL